MKTLGWCKYLLIGCILACSAQVASAQIAKLAFEEIAQSADLIFTGTVESQTSRVNSQGRMILTDVIFKEVTVINATARAKQEQEKQIRLTYAGGTVGGVGISVSETPHFETGHRYLIFMQDDGETYSNPLMGGDQGMFEIIRDENSGAEYLLNAAGKVVTSLDTGGVQVSTFRAKAVRNGLMVADPSDSPAEFSHSTPPSAAGAGDRAESSRAGNRQSGKSERPLPLSGFLRQLTGVTLKQPVRNPQIKREETGLFYYHDQDGQLRSVPLQYHQPAVLPRIVEGSNGRLTLRLETPRADDDTQSGNVFTKRAGDNARSAINAPTGGTVGYCGYQNLNLVMEMVPRSFWSWDVANENMAIWNLAMDVFRYVDSDGTYGNNSRNEFMGFPSSNDLASVYGEGFRWGATTLAKCITYSNSECGRILQSDIGWNPAYSWTTDMNVSLYGTAKLLHPVNMHELGHAWGAQRGPYRETYDYDIPTVMQGDRSNDIVEDGKGVHAADANMIRRLYSDQRAVNTTWRDVGVESYYASNGLNNSRPNALVYRPGQSITLNDVTVENISRNAVSDLRIRFYLSTNNIISTGDYQMGGYWYWTSFEGERYNVSSYTTTIPANTPPGTYYIGAIVTINGYEDDNWWGNNSIYFFDRITVVCNGAFSFSSAGRSVGSGGEAGSATLIGSGSACPRTASSTTSWLAISSGGSGNGGGTISFTAAANTGSARSGAITVAGAQYVVSQAAGCLVTTATSLSVPATFTGSLTTGDCLSRQRLVAGLYRPYADRFTFSGTAGQRIALTLQSGSLDTYIYILSPSGAVLASDDDSGGGTNSRIPASGFLTLPTTGTYTIEVTSYQQGVTGNYQLLLTKL